MNNQMKFCPSCGGKLPEPAPKFCPYCGAQVPVVGASGNSVPANANPVPATGTQNSALQNTAPAKVGFGKAISLFWSRYFDFKGKSTRAEFWWALLFCFFFNLIPFAGILTIIPGWAITCRRFRDAGKSFGKWLLIVFLLILAGFAVFGIAYVTNTPFLLGPAVILWIFSLIYSLYGIIICCKASVSLGKEAPVPEKIPPVKNKMIKIPYRNFSIGQFPVTRKEYFDVMGENPSDFKSSPNLPVENVSWNDAMAYCEKLTERERKNGKLPKGYKYSLPTSEQWEFACRAGTTTKYYSGDSEADLARVAWYSGNSSYKTHPVGQKEANVWGIYDMHGNVWEWCLDSRDSKRIRRGGSWRNYADDCESSNVGSYFPRDRDRNIGFRVALVPVE